MADEWIDVTDQYVDRPEEDGWQDVTSQYVDSTPPPPEPGWGETITTNIGTGAANIIGGFGSLVDSLPGFDFGVGDWIKSTAEPYQRGGQEFNQKIPESSWKKTAANVTQGAASSLPLLPLAAGSIPSLVTTFGLNNYGQTVNELERQGLPEDVVSKTAALKTLGQMPLDAIGMAPIFNKSLGPLTRGLYAGGTNAAFALPGAAMDAYSRYLGGATNERPSLENIPWGQAMLEGGITGFLAGTAQAGMDSIGDYRGARALKAKTNEIQQRIDAAEAAAKMAQIVEAGTTAPPVTPIDDGFAFSPTGDPNRVFDQSAAQDFANQQALTKMGVTDPVGAEIAKAEIARAKSPTGKLEAEAKGIAAIVPRVEKEIETLKKIQEQTAQTDPLNAEAYTKDIADREAMLQESQKRLDEIQKELDPAPINSDPVVARERVLSGTEETVDLAPTIDPDNLTLDNSSNVFPEGISKPAPVPEPQAPVVTKPREASVPKIIEEGSTKNTIKKSPVRPKDSGLVNDFPNPFSVTGLKDFVGRIRGNGFKDLPDIYKFFTNKWKNPLTSQITKSDKYPWFRKSHEPSIKHFEEENSILYDMNESTRPFALLSPKEQLETSALAYEAMRRGPEFDSSPANLKSLGFSDRVIRGYKSVRNTMDNALEGLRKETLTKIEEDTKMLPEEKAKFIAEKNKEFDYMKVSNYVPTGRSGKFGLSLWNKDGTLSEFIMNDSKVKLLKTLYSKLRTNPELDPNASKVSPTPKTVGSEYIGAHPDILDMLGDTGAHIPATSFLNRLKRKQLIEGFDEDLGKNLASYMSSYARYISTQNLKRQYNQTNKEFAAFYNKLGKKDKTVYSGLKSEIENLQKWMLTPSKDLSKVSKALSTFYLASNVKTTLVNTTSFLTAYPNVARYMSGLDNLTLQPEFVFAKAMKDTAAYYGGKLFAKKEGIVGKDLRASIEQARKEGAIGGSRLVQDLLRDGSQPSRGKFGQKISDQDALFFLNSATEDFVRTAAYNLGWHLWDKADPYFKKNNLPKPNRHEFAKRFIRETQADYTKAGIPNISRSVPGKLLSTFRLFHHSFFTTLKKSVMEKNFGALSRYAGVLGSLGGVYAMPFVSSILKTLKGVGYDPDEKIKEGTEAIGQAIQKGEEATLDLGIGKYLQTPQGKQVVKYGLPTMLGMNVSGAISPDIMRDAPGGDPIGAVGRAALGVLADPIDRADKFFYFLNEKGQLGRAIEQVLPRTFGMSDIYSAARIEKEGLRDSNNINLLTSAKDPEGRKPTEYELMLKRLSIMPSTWSAAYDKQIKERKIAEKKDTKGIYQRIASEMMFGGDEGVNRLMEEAMGMGIPFSDIVKNTMKWDKKMTFPELAQREKLGKKYQEDADRLNEEMDPLINP